MGKKLPNIVIYKRYQNKKNIPSIKKTKKLNNQRKKKQKKNKHKNLKINQSPEKFSSKKKDKISNHSNYNNNITYENDNNSNPFIFNTFINNKKEKEKEKDKPDWMKTETKTIKNIDERFNEEIIEYVNYIIPKDSTLSQRHRTKQCLTNIIQKYKPNWRVVLFGSFSQNTSTVFSDLDFAVLSDDIDSSRKMDINELIYIMKILRNNGFSRNIRLIRARVPILKATCSLTGINVDISVNRQNGYEAAGLIRKILKKYKILKPTIIILKILLKKYNLNDAHTGGMSSFLLFHLVYFFFIQYQRRTQRENYFNNNTSINNNKKHKNNSIRENISNDEEDADEEKEVSYDSNSDIKWNKKHKNSNEDGIIISKAISSTDEEENSNDDEEDSNIINNGVSSSISDEDQKLTQCDSKSKNGYNYNEYINDISDNEDDDNDNDNENEEEEDDYLMKNYNKKKEEKNEIYNIGEFLFKLLKFYSKEFDYENLGFSINSNNFGNTFFKVERTDMDCSETICAESIQDQGIDVGRSCYNYRKIVNLFKNTYETIKIEKQKNTISILESLGFPSI